MEVTKVIYGKNSITVDRVLTLMVDGTYQAYQVTISFSGDYNEDIGNIYTITKCYEILDTFNQSVLDTIFKKSSINRFIKYITLKILRANNGITQITTSVRNAEYVIQSITLEVVNN
jgi:hypothetical protein